MNKSTDPFSAVATVEGCSTSKVGCLAESQDATNHSGFAVDNKERKMAVIAMEPAQEASLRAIQHWLETQGAAGIVNLQAQHANECQRQPTVLFPLVDAGLLTSGIRVFITNTLTMFGYPPRVSLWGKVIVPDGMEEQYASGTFWACAHMLRTGVITVLNDDITITR